MPSLNENFNELIDRIRHGRELNHASFEPIYYLVFSPMEILEVKKMTSVWISRLKNDGWNVHCFSIAENILDIFQNAPMRKFWITADSKAPTDWKRTNDSLTNFLTNGSLQSRIECKLEEISGDKNSILLVTDLEALHPYMRIGAIESRLQGKFNIPTVFLYPGERTGKSQLKFLGFYPEDGNYRSVHVGG